MALRGTDDLDQLAQDQRQLAGPLSDIVLVETPISLHIAGGGGFALVPAIVMTALVLAWLVSWLTAGGRLLGLR